MTPKAPSPFFRAFLAATMPRLYISATHKSSGKTTLCIGLCRELSRLGYRVQPFKKGPDYIDPLWLSQAAGRDCLNLDFNTMAPAEIRAALSRRMVDVDLGLIEGNVGLFDATDLAGSNSNAELAKLLETPVVLVVDVQGMSRGLAPLLLGYQAFDPGLRIAGLILNKVGGSRHEANLRRVVEHYTDLPMLGAIHREMRPRIQERHLGLMPSTESQEAEAQIEDIRAMVARQVDLDLLIRLAGSAPELAVEPPSRLVTRSEPEAPGRWPPGQGDRVRIGIARDEAFGFYYPDDLEALEAAGADLIPFSPVRDPDLPVVDGLFIGGGFPEYRMRELAANVAMRMAIRDFITAGGPAYAECGGLMYLCQGLRWGEDYAPMCGVLRAEVSIHERPQGRGYIRLREREGFPWPRGPEDAREIQAHEFHHSAILDPDPDWVYGFEVLRGAGIDGRHDGILWRNLVASYAHLRHVGGVNWPARFVAHVRRIVHPMSVSRPEP